MKLSITFLPLLLIATLSYTPETMADDHALKHGQTADQATDKHLPPHLREKSLILGVGVGYSAKYSGSEDNRFIPMPSVNYRNRNFFINTNGFGITNSGVGYRLVDTDNINFGAIANLDLGRSEDRSNDLNGLGDVDPSLLGGAYAEFRWQNFRLSTVAMASIAGDTDGYGARVSLGYQLNLGRRLSVNPVIGTTWLSGTYLNTYYGVDSQQSIRSGLPEYQTDSGIESIGFGVNARYIINDHWAIMGIASVRRLANNVDNSPIVAESRPSMVAFSVLYVF